MKRIDTFQNLALIALADGQVTSQEKNTIHQYAESMGIAMEEANSLLSRINELDFIIPASPEEKINELNKLIIIALADYELADAEYDQLLYFAESCGFTEDELNNIIDNASTKMEEQETLVISDNKLQYDEVLKGIRSSGIKDKEISALLIQCTREKTLIWFFLMMRK